MYELADRLHMTVAELCHGRGTAMSAHELSVGWPAYFAYRQRQAEREEREQATRKTPRRRVG